MKIIEASGERQVIFTCYYGMSEAEKSPIYETLKYKDKIMNKRVHANGEMERKAKNRQW